MEQSTAERRLVKSPPELWAEVSSEDTLRRHFSEFGEIRITRVHPETTVAWEGDRASGTVELAPAGWGTKVVLTATPLQQAAAEPEPARFVMPLLEAPIARPAAPPPAAAPERRGFFARLFHRPAPVAEIPPPGPHDPSPPTPAPDPTPPAPSPTPPPAPDPVPPAPAPAPDPMPPQIRAPAMDPERTVAILTEVLDDLGAAHHRPFSRD